MKHRIALLLIIALLGLTVAAPGPHARAEGVFVDWSCGKQVTGPMFPVWNDPFGNPPPGQPPPYGNVYEYMGAAFGHNFSSWNDPNWNFAIDPLSMSSLMTITQSKLSGQAQTDFINRLVAGGCPTGWIGIGVPHDEYGQCHDPGSPSKYNINCIAQQLRWLLDIRDAYAPQCKVLVGYPNLWRPTTGWHYTFPAQLKAAYTALYPGDYRKPNAVGFQHYKWDSDPPGWTYQNAIGLGCKYVRVSYPQAECWFPEAGALQTPNTNGPIAVQAFYNTRHNIAMTKWNQVFFFTSFHKTLADMWISFFFYPPGVGQPFPPTDFPPGYEQMWGDWPHSNQLWFGAGLPFSNPYPEAVRDTDFCTP